MTCPHCAAGNPPRWRSQPAPGEWIHDYVDEAFWESLHGEVLIRKQKGAFAHTICRDRKDPPLGK